MFFHAHPDDEAIYTLKAHRSQQLADDGARTLGVFLRLPAWLFTLVLGILHRSS